LDSNLGGGGGWGGGGGSTSWRKDFTGSERVCKVLRNADRAQVVYRLPSKIEVQHGRVQQSLREQKNQKFYTEKGKKDGALGVG